MRVLRSVRQIKTAGIFGDGLEEQLPSDRSSYEATRALQCSDKCEGTNGELQFALFLSRGLEHRTSGHVHKMSETSRREAVPVKSRSTHACKDSAFSLSKCRSMKERIPIHPRTEISLRRIWSLLEVHNLTSGPSTLIGDEARRQVLPSMEVYPDVRIHVPAILSITHRQVFLAFSARIAVRSRKAPDLSTAKATKKPGESEGGKALTPTLLLRIRIFPLSNFPLQFHFVSNARMIADTLDFMYLGHQQRERNVVRIKAQLAYHQINRSKAESFTRRPW